MSSIRESVRILKNVFLSTRKMKFLIIWFIINIFLQILNILSSRDEFILNPESFIFSLMINMNLLGQEYFSAILNAIPFSLIYMKNQTYTLVNFIAIMCCGLSTFIFWLVREGMADKAGSWGARPSAKFFIFGSLGAVWVEFIFWFLGKLFNTQGLAANPSFLLDLLATMPWYCLMVGLFWIVHKRYAYTLVEVAFLGGFYEFISPDGVMSALFSGQFGNLILLPVVIPMFILIYSYILIPATIMTRKEIETINSVHPDRWAKKRYAYALIPLLGLIPYAFILPIFLA